MLSLTADVRICLSCYEKHEQALEALSGKREPECQECLKSLTDLAAERGTDTVPMVAHWKDGVYQLLCVRCSDRYEQQRRDLYGETAYAKRKGIA
jgi:hypothetical protein